MHGKVFWIRLLSIVSLMQLMTLKFLVTLLDLLVPPYQLLLDSLCKARVVVVRCRRCLHLLLLPTVFEVMIFFVMLCPLLREQVFFELSLESPLLINQLLHLAEFELELLFGELGLLLLRLLALILLHLVGHRLEI